MSAPLLPDLRLERFFDGETLCHGWFEDRFGRVLRTFEVRIQGLWDGTVLTLDEAFLYDNGETEQRVWHLHPDGPTGYVAECDQLVRPTRGTVRGHTFEMVYDFRMRIGGRPVVVQFSDWMRLQSPDVMLNRSRVTKFGIHLGTACLVFQRQPSAATLPLAAE